MKQIHIAGTEDTPEIILDNTTKTYKISGRSLPEDVTSFYAPVIEWLDEAYVEDMKEGVFQIKLEYFNTASSKVLLDILMKLENIDVAGKGKIKIQWHYDSNDDDMKEAGEEYKELVELAFELIAY